MLFFFLIGVVYQITSENSEVVFRFDHFRPRTHLTVSCFLASAYSIMSLYLSNNSDKSFSYTIRDDLFISIENSYGTIQPGETIFMRFEQPMEMANTFHLQYT